LLARIVFIKSRVQACYLVLAATVLWGIGSFLTIAIRCTDHPPWQIIGNDTCPSLVCSVNPSINGHEKISPSGEALTFYDLFSSLSGSSLLLSMSSSSSPFSQCRFGLSGDYRPASDAKSLSSPCSDCVCRKSLQPIAGGYERPR
jgi:hypothetical protein